jgi:ABC-type Fe3+/spermidine/putrescine transport system ATPase subunit
MFGGRIVQEAAPRELYLKPKTSFVAQFVGQINFFEGTVVDPCPEGLGTFETAYGRWRCVIPGSLTKGASGKLAVRPEGFTLLSSAEAVEQNVLDGKVEKATFLGDAIECLVSVGDQIVTAKIPAKREIVEGQQILLRFGPDACLILPSETT